MSDTTKESSKLSRVMALLPKIEDSDGKERIINLAIILIDRDWKLIDIVQYLCQQPEVNPNLDESVSIRKMTQIMDKYVRDQKKDCVVDTTKEVRCICAYSGCSGTAHIDVKDPVKAARCDRCVKAGCYPNGTNLCRAGSK